MNHRVKNSQGVKQRSRIASAAARLIAENGVGDYTLAKRKAAQGLGLPDNTPLPENAEVASELITYQSLFQAEEQAIRITHLRQKSRDLMSILQRFRPYLTGAVLDGTAGRYADIDIQLYTDSVKEVEIFLLNRRITYEHDVPRSGRAEAVLSIHDDGVTVNLIIYPTREERVTTRTRDGSVRPRAHLDALDSLLGAAGAGRY